MSRVLILGIGSPSADDQAGWLVIDALHAAGMQQKDNIHLEKLDRPGANLVSILENADWAILVDAMQGTGAAGRIQRFDRGGWRAHEHGLSSHGLGVLAALALAHELGSLPARLDLYGIEIGSAAPIAPAGSAVRLAAGQLAGMIMAELEASGQ